MSQIQCRVEGPGDAVVIHNYGIAAFASLDHAHTLHWVTGGHADEPLVKSIRAVVLPGGTSMTFDLTSGLWLFVTWAGCTATGKRPYLVTAEAESTIDTLITADQGSAKDWAIIANLDMHGPMYRQQ